MNSASDFDINKIASDLLDRNIEKIYSAVKKFIKDEASKFKIDFGFAFKEYLKNAFEKYSRIKTLLYRTEPKFIYDFFECNTLHYGNENIDSGDINNILNISNFIIIQGTGGIGKTTLLKHFFLNELTKKDLIPIFVELRDINKSDKKLIECIFESLTTLGFSMDIKYFTYALRSGRFLFLLDGFDEISSLRYDDTMREICKLSDQYCNNYFIISSRPNDTFISMQRYTILKSCPLTKEQAVSLIVKLEYDTQIKEKFLTELQTTLYDQHKSFASNPLLINIMLMTFDNYAQIPEKLHIFYENAFETLFLRHDATKGGFRREIHSKLSYDNFKKVFAKFCFITFSRSEFEFSYENMKRILKDIEISFDFKFDIDLYIKDLNDAVCVIYLDGNKYIFSHRSFQEYFAALFLKDLNDEMQKIASSFLISDGRFLNDNVFDMLFDMSKDRFEKNILIPILQNLEHEINPENDRYKEFLKKIIRGLRLQKVGNNKHISLLYHINEAYIFLFYFTNHYFNKPYYDMRKTSYEKQLLVRLETEGKVLIKDIVDDLEFEQYIRKTIAGKKIQIISEMLEKLTRKQESIRGELDTILNSI